MLPERIEEEIANTNLDESVIRIPSIERPEPPPSPTRAGSPTLLERVSSHYLDHKNLPSSHSEGWKQLFMFIVALSGAPLYAIPADNYSVRTYGENFEMRVNFIIGTCTPALLVLYNSTDIFLIMRALGKPPEVLRDVLSMPSARKRFIEELGIYIGAALSAVPLTMISLAYPIPAPRAAVYLMAAIVEIDNTVLHFLPMQLALQNPYYRFPLLPFEWMHKNCFKKEFTVEELRKIEIDEKNARIFQQFKDKLFNVLTSAKKEIALHRFVFNKSKFAYELHQPSEISEILCADNKPGLWKLNKIAKIQLETAKRKKLQESFITHAEANKRRLAEQRENVLKNFLYAVGAFWIVSGCSGYLAGTVSQMSDMTDSPVAGSILSSASIYLLVVLFAFLGGNYLQNVYDYMTSWKEDDIKIPIEFKMYPKMSLSLVAVAAYLAAFSYAAADELIEDSFDRDTWGGMYDALRWLAVTGIPFVSFSAMIDFYIRSMNKFAMYFGQGDARIIAVLFNVIDGFQNSIKLMPNEELIKSIDSLEEEDLTTLFDMSLLEYRDAMSELTTPSSSDVEPDEVVSASSSPTGRYRPLSAGASRSKLFGGSPESSPPGPSSRTLTEAAKLLGASQSFSSAPDLTSLDLDADPVSTLESDSKAARMSA